MKFDPTIFRPENPWFLGEMPNSYLILNFDQSYLGRVILVPKKESPDLESLPPRDLSFLMDEVVYVGGQLKKEFSAARMNYASLGNVVEQLHWHIIPRYMDDANWGGPPWPVATPKEPSAEERAAIVARIKRALYINAEGIAQVEPVFPVAAEFIEAYWRVVEAALSQVFEVSESLATTHRAKIDASSYDERLKSYLITPIEVAAMLAGTEITQVHIERYRPLQKLLAHADAS
jgi:diadenosine tetraphosphate (Ap4A) HIT family hydrolase